MLTNEPYCKVLPFYFLGGGKQDRFVCASQSDRQSDSGLTYGVLEFVAGLSVCLFNL